MIDWAWTQTTTKNGKYKIFSAINISILLNSGNSDDEVNINPESETSSKFSSLRDIKRGGGAGKFVFVLFYCVNV